jgi:hypothetical protein
VIVQKRFSRPKPLFGGNNSTRQLHPSQWVKSTLVAKGLETSWILLENSLELPPAN